MTAGGIAVAYRMTLCNIRSDGPSTRLLVQNMSAASPSIKFVNPLSDDRRVHIPLP